MPTLRRIYRAPAGLEDRLAGELWAAGMLGLEVRPGEGDEITVVAYFPQPAAVEATASPTPRGAVLVSEETEPDRDWLAAWRTQAQPIAVGRRWLIDPREPEAGRMPEIAPELTADRHLLRLPARTAFGLGSHESTRLVLELMEDIPLVGRRVLEVGCGTGILALAARRAGCGWALGFDTDLAAPLLAGQYARSNGIRAVFLAGPVRALRAGGARRFDLALVNVVPEQIQAELPAVFDLLAPTSEAVFSGILAAEGAAASAALAAAGFVPFAERRAGEWIAFRSRRAERP